jgi:alkanesulfonate monooxygenase SsuD/methylene tetrahydromethanopterin reductase-like flavin-dependent oxidoreductase (luciferase family)
VFAAKRAVLRHCCEEAGRDPDEVRCAVNVGLAWREEDVEPQFGAMRMAVLPGVLQGSEQEVLDRIGAYVDAGADQVNIALRAYGPTRGDRPNWDVEGLERLAVALGLG